MTVSTPFQPLPPPFQPPAKVPSNPPTNPFPTPVRTHPHTPIGLAPSLGGGAQPFLAVRNHSRRTTK